MSLFINIRIKDVIRKISKGNTKKALQILNGMNKDVYEVMYYKGICHFDLSNFEEAMLYLEKAYQCNKEDSELALLLAQVYILENESKKSLKILKQYKEHPESKYFIEIIMLGEASIKKYILKTNLIGNAINCLKDNNYEKSIQLFENALDYVSDKKECAKILNQIGGIYCNYYKNTKKAKEYFLQASKMAPGVIEYQKNYLRAQSI